MSRAGRSDASGQEEVFVDPFADTSDDYDDVPMTRADYGLADPVASTSADRVIASSKSVGRSTSSPLAPFSADHLNSLDLAAAMNAGALAMPAVGQAMAGDGKRYLVHERRGLWGQASYNVGYSYSLGLALGGLYGGFHGIRASPNNMARVLLNSVLNGCGKFGARAGNAAGVLALVYTVTERQLEDAEVDRLPAWANNLAGRDIFPHSRLDLVLPASAALATGMLFSVPRAVTMKGVDRIHVSLPKRLAVVGLGGVACLLGVGSLSVMGPLIFGERSPFRFA